MVTEIICLESLDYREFRLLTTREYTMNNIIYLVGLVVIVVAIVSFVL